MHTMIQITDLHIDNNDPELKSLNPKDNFDEFLKYADETPCDKIIVTGDVAEAEENFQTIINKLQDLCGNIKYVAGNHDPEVGSILMGQEKKYSMEYLEGFLVLYLDSRNGTIDYEQLQWLTDVTLKNEKDIIIFIHHPILDCGNTIMDRSFPLMNRSEVYRILQHTGKRVYIFCGHYHWEQEVQSDNIKQYVTPSLLYQLDRNADHFRIGSIDFGIRVIKISMDQVVTYVEMLAGN